MFKIGFSIVCGCEMYRAIHCADAGNFEGMLKVFEKGKITLSRVCKGDGGWRVWEGDRVL